MLARVEGAGRRELTCVLVPMDAPGATRGPIQQTIMADGQTGVLEFRDVPVPADAVVGEVGGGLAMAFLWINWARSRRGGMCSGLAWHCVERSVAYSRERKAFGKAIGELGAVAERLSDMYMDFRAMRALSLEILARLDDVGLLAGGRVDAAARRDLSTLKTWCDEALMRVSGPRHPGPRRPRPAHRHRPGADLPRRPQPAHPGRHHRGPAGDDRRDPDGGGLGQERLHVGRRPAAMGPPSAATPGRAAGRRRSGAPASGRRRSAVPGSRPRSRSRRSGPRGRPARPARPGGAAPGRPSGSPRGRLASRGRRSRRPPCPRTARRGRPARRRPPRSSAA